MIPIEKAVTDFYAVEYLTEFVPQNYTERVLDYVQQETINEVVSYVPVERYNLVYSVNVSSPPLRLATAPWVLPPWEWPPSESDSPDLLLPPVDNMAMDQPMALEWDWELVQLEWALEVAFLMEPVTVQVSV